MNHPRKPLYAPHGVAATTQPLAAAAAANVLRRGGNALDAALAAATTLTVVQPGSNDIGGDLFAIVWDGHRLHGLNASGRSPAGLTREAVAENRTPDRGWPTVTVPGAPAGWRDLHERFGSLPFADLFADAIRYAEHGYPVSPGVAESWAKAVAQQARLTGPEFEEWRRVWTIGGQAPRAGQRWRNPDAARTLRLIADSRAEAFYHGEIARALADHATRTGGFLTTDDLARHTSTWVEPVAGRYRGHQVWELPPNGQGVAALLALHLLDGLDLSGADGVHLQIEAMKLAFADAHAYVADPELVPVPTEALLSREYAARRRAEIGETAAEPKPGDPARGGTVYLCTADSDGMMVSLIQSNYMGFGSYVAVPGYGFGLQNRGAGFSLDPAHPNVAAPGKRPLHTIIPGFLTRDGEPVGPFGVMGGHMQPQGHLQLLVRTLDEGLDPQAALDAPRWYWHAGKQVHVEPAYGEPVLAGLRERGHEVVAGGAFFGYGQAIWRLPDGGYVAGSEPRADGCAIGY
ncbi:MAG TPA: gamma-glutamyltransferase family protein [Natronosporangium sp.]